MSISKAQNRRILVAVDGSPASLRAVDEAAAWAPILRADLSIVSALDTEWIRVVGGEAFDETSFIATMQKDVIDRAVARARERGVVAAGRLVRGAALKALLAESESDDVVLVCLGRTGKNAMDRVLEGSTTRWMSVHCGKPVVIVGEFDPWRAKPERIFVALDGTPSSERAFAWAQDLAWGAGATLEVGVVVDILAPTLPHQVDQGPAVYARREAARAILDRAATSLGERVRVETTQLEGPVAETLLDHIARGRPDLVVVGRSGKGPLARVLEGSVSRSLAVHSTAPLAIIP